MSDYTGAERRKGGERRGRGTSNSNTRGSVYDRRRRRAFLWDKFSNGRTIPCFWCGKRLRRRFEVDRWPVCGHAGGRYTRDNIVPACQKCNGGRCSVAGRGCRGRAPLRQRAFGFYDRRAMAPEDMTEGEAA